VLTLRKLASSPALREYVRHYEYREIVSDNRVAVRPLPARPEQLLHFHLLNRFAYWDHGLHQTVLAPSAIVVGPSTHRTADLLLRGTFVVFVIVFQPTGFHQLFRLPMTDLTDRAYEAEDILGRDVRVVHDRLHHCRQVGDMFHVTEEYLLGKLRTSHRVHSLQAAAAQMLRRHGQVDLQQLVNLSGLSHRQFRRKFAEQVGIAPKLYARINRLQHALQLKAECPTLTWTDVTYRAGYFDQMHLVKDFKSLTGEAPSRFLAMLSTDPDVLVPDSLSDPA
jgi:AraC-like DNA-binding protein